MRVVACIYADSVSTHSRLKAAGRQLDFARQLQRRFNTQPPEGGWGARCQGAG